jgi:NitT/TauT family transport system substrate-binding protein
VTRKPAIAFCLAGLCLLFSGCRKQEQTSGLIPVKLQTDWYPQPEHGGFYDAQLRGYYKDEGLDVTILPGGPYANSDQQVSLGAVQFAMGSSDHVLQVIGNGLPLVAVAATMQHDPQALMVHEDSPVKTFQDLDGHSVAIRVGMATWFDYLVGRYQLKNVREIPATYSVADFLADPKYIQQIFVTSEPFFVRQAGVKARTLLISDTGYDPYRVMVTSQPYLKEHPEVVEKFVRASVRGWKDYLVHPEEVNAQIAKLNPAMSIPLMKFSYEALRDQNFITGKAPNQADVGRFDPARWTNMYQQLLQLKLIHNPFDVTSAYTVKFANP